MSHAPQFTRADYEHAASTIRALTAHRPTVGLILGSGLAGIADSVEEADVIQYQQIPHMPFSSVIGHKNQFVIGKLGGHTVIVQQGRAHFYEGYTMHEVTFAVRVMQMLGVKLLIPTNASGGVNPSFTAGTVMLITDHINLVGMTGLNPLIGRNDDELGTRFPDMTTTYDPELLNLARGVATEQQIELKEGVYCALTGPLFETPAEIRMLRVWGADAVGMSTVPEVVAARHGGMRVMAFSGVANVAHDSTDPALSTTHVEVLDNINRLVAPRMTRIIRGVLEKLPPSSQPST